LLGYREDDARIVSETEWLNKSLPWGKSSLQCVCRDHVFLTALLQDRRSLL
jgi:hypothetical protein